MNQAQSIMAFAARNPIYEWWSANVTDHVEHREVVARVQADAGWSAHFAFMTLMSAGIAVLGLLLSSPAVVIGAMLISPLMGPIIGLGFAIATFDSVEIRRTSFALAVGTGLAILFCAMIVVFSPLQTVTQEIAARTRPNLFDLLVALFSGLAGTYAMIRGRQGAIVGVAIATALMPPLAVVGFGLATTNWTVFWGAALLFFTNLMTIAASAAILARLYGFAAALSPRQTGLQATLIILVLVALAVPLGLSLRQIAWEALASRQVNEVISSRFGKEVRVSDITIDFDTDPISVSATVLTPEFRRNAEREAASMLRTMLRQPVEVSIEQFRVGTESGDAEATQIAAARGATRERTGTRVAERLALVAGVPVGEVMIDSSHSQALVRAAALPGAGLAVYRALETRVSASEPGWTVSLVPPAAPLPQVQFGEEGQPDQRALALAIWGAQRLSLPIGVQADEKEQAVAIVEALIKEGITARHIDGGGGAAGVARLVWLAPEQPGQNEGVATP
jgi:uncharacterized hydrophobic protein (TIGR00271 family)